MKTVRVIVEVEITNKQADNVRKHGIVWDMMGKSMFTLCGKPAKVKKGYIV